MSEDERIAYLAGDPDVPLDPVERARLDELHSLLAEPAVWVEPNPALQERIVDAITEARDTPSPTPVPSQVAGTPPVVDELTARRRSRRIRYLVIGVAAAVLLAVGVTIGVTNHGSRGVEFAASMTGTELATGASGHATLRQTTGGWKIHLRATGLPRLDNGQYYEAWLKSPAGILVPIGTFNQPADVTLWAGVPPSNYPTLTVTRQRANGNPASSGQVVLIGTTHRTH
jgi:hypothetical protein